MKRICHLDDETHGYLYNPTEEVLELIGSLADSEGLAIWQPNIKN